LFTFLSANRHIIRYFLVVSLVLETVDLNKQNMMKQNLTKLFLNRSLYAFVWGIVLTLSASGQNLPTATATASAMTMGWNLGNTLEATGGETNWGNPLTTQKLIDSVKAAGFNTIRIPCSWDQYANQTTHVIDATWMARVKAVVDYCVKDNLYVILNIHWDGGWLENNCTQAAQASVNVKQNSYWTQIATTFKSYDGHVLFASANEPAVADATQMSVLLSYHQTFINAVRATGGNNSSRVLIVQGPSTDISKTNTLMNTMPTDVITNRLMVEVHYYTPYNFCLMTADADWGKQFYYWGKGHHSTTDIAHNPNYDEEAELDNNFQLMKAKFVDKGIPVIIGEFGAIKRDTLKGTALALHISSREYFYNYLVKSASCHGLVPVYWDAGFIGVNSFTLLNRTTGAIVDKGAVNALKNGLNCGKGIVTDLEEADVQNNEILLFPNPFSSSFQLKIERPEQINRITVVDMLGNIVEIKEQGLTDSFTLGSSLPAGLYSVQVHSASNTHSFKVIKK
jgi:aryl-phospho-beta-D-glucosidase BglC (GH1 family)